MMEESTAVWSGVLVLVGFGYLYVGLRAKSVWEEPGGELFSGLGVALALGAWMSIPGVAFYENHNWTLLEVGGEVFILLLPVLWAAFTARRAGASWLPRRRAGRLTAAFVLVMAEFRIAGLVLEGAPMTAESFNGSYVLAVTIPTMVAYLASSSLLVIGVALLIKQTLEYEHIKALPAVTVSLGVIVPWLSMWIGMAVAEEFEAATALVVLGVGFPVGMVAFGLSYGRYDLFAASAAAGTVGRNRVIATMDDAVVVVDDDSRVLDLNPVAASSFETAVEDIAGQPIDTVVGEDLDTVRSSDVLELGTAYGRRSFEPTVSTVTGPDGDLLGYSVVLRDVTERRNREQRLSVLNRVLRHNLRNEMSIVSGYAEMLAEQGTTTDDDQIATDIAMTANDLMELGEKARVVEEVMAEPPTTSGRTAVETLVEEAIDNVRADTADCEFEVSVSPDLTVTANPRVLQPVVENLVENAVEHNDADEPRVEIRAERESDGETVTITVVDNGPGIPEQERKVLESGDVSPLEHGSGLGLWVAKWGAMRLGGALSLAAAEPRGTVATLRIPESVPETTQPSMARS